MSIKVFLRKVAKEYCIEKLIGAITVIVSHRDEGKMVEELGVAQYLTEAQAKELAARNLTYEVTVTY